MKILRNWAMTATLCCAAASAHGQYNPYTAPATLPAPMSAGQPGAYYTPAPYSMANYMLPGSPMVSHGYESPGAAPVPPGYPTNEPGYPTNEHVYQEALSGGCQSCGKCCWSPSWYGSVAGLIMTRDHDDEFHLSFDFNNPNVELLCSAHDYEWVGGGEVTVGRYLCCTNAVEFSYWTLDEFDRDTLITDPTGNISTPIDFRSLTLGGAPVNDYFDNAQAHRLQMQNNIDNFELNLLHMPVSHHCGGRLRLSSLVGLRVFRFDESFLFSTSDNSPVFGVDPTAEASYEIGVDNTLYGVQFGGRADLNVLRGLSVYASPRFGVYGNHIEHHSQLYSHTGDVAFDIENDKEDVSLIGQIDLGVNYQINCRWSAYVAYRAMAVSRLALTANQIPYLQDDLVGISNIDTNATVVLHGAMAGVRFNY